MMCSAAIELHGEVGAAWSLTDGVRVLRTGNQPNAYAAIRNLVTGAFRRAGFANVAHARRYYGHDDQRILALYEYR